MPRFGVPGHRKVPLGKWLGPGWCKWCGFEIKFLDGPKMGQRNERRYWHPECAHEFELHSRASAQFDYVAGRDGERCIDCGASPKKWIRGEAMSSLVQEFQRKDAWAWEFWTAREIGPLPRCFDPLTGTSIPEHRDVWMLRGGQCSIQRVSALEVDHIVPLWKVADLPGDERRPYFGPRNLRLRCPPCHKAKTKREAAERAQARRPKRDCV